MTDFLILYRRLWFFQIKILIWFLSFTVTSYFRFWFRFSFLDDFFIRFLIQILIRIMILIQCLVHSAMVSDWDNIRFLIHFLILILLQIKIMNQFMIGFQILSYFLYLFRIVTLISHSDLVNRLKLFWMQSIILFQIKLIYLNHQIIHGSKGCILGDTLVTVVPGERGICSW